MKSKAVLMLLACGSIVKQMKREQHKQSLDNFNSCHAKALTNKSQYCFYCSTQVQQRIMCKKATTFCLVFYTVYDKQGRNSLLG
jgi:hypothetical protein